MADLDAAGADEMVTDPQVEAIAMQVTMDYERAQGRTPEDVSKENLGFDVRSSGKDGQRRYIEVKGRAGSGSAALTQNEWFKAQRFQDEYHLYAVLNVVNQPELYRIQNPAAVLRPEQEVEVRYLVSRRDILERGLKG